MVRQHNENGLANRAHVRRSLALQEEVAVSHQAALFAGYGEPSGGGSGKLPAHQKRQESGPLTRLEHQRPRRHSQHAAVGGERFDLAAREVAEVGTDARQGVQQLDHVLRRQLHRLLQNGGQVVLNVLLR
eukprot:1590603-Pyramimonas_sp.AAC.1